MLFAAEPFAGRRDDEGRWPDAQVVVMAITGCRGSFDRVSSEREVNIQGFPAWARELSVGEGPTAGEVYAYEYFINLTPNRPCELGRSLVVRTERAAPGEHNENKNVLDGMVSTLRFADAD